MKNKIFIKVKPPTFSSRLFIYRQDSQKYTFALSIKRRYDRIVTGSLKKKKDARDSTKFIRAYSIGIKFYEKQKEKSFTWKTSERLILTRIKEQSKIPIYQRMESLCF